MRCMPKARSADGDEQYELQSQTFIEEKKSFVLFADVEVDLKRIRAVFLQASFAVRHNLSCVHHA